MNPVAMPEPVTWFFPGYRQRLISRIAFERADIEWDSEDYPPGEWPSSEDDAPAVAERRATPV